MLPRLLLVPIPYYRAHETCDDLRANCLHRLILPFLHVLKDHGLELEEEFPAIIEEEPFEVFSHSIQEELAFCFDGGGGQKGGVEQFADDFFLHAKHVGRAAQHFFIF